MLVVLVHDVGKLREILRSEFFIDNLLVRIHFIIVMIRWTGPAPWEFESPYVGSPGARRRQVARNSPQGFRI